MEHKGLRFKLSSLEEKGQFTGHAAVFNNVDSGGDKILKGAFDKSLKANSGKVPILADHDPTSQIGWGLEARETGKGLEVVGVLDIENNQQAREKYSLMKKAEEIGVSCGLSIGYTVEDSDFEKNGVQVLKELELFEYSFVAFPMNEKATVLASKDSGKNKNQIDCKAIAKDFAYISAKWRFLTRTF